MTEDTTALLEADRRRIAALLESSVIASLNLLLAQVNVYEHALASEPQASMAVAVLGSLIRQTLQKARDLQANLHPTVLEVLGLEPALEALISQFGRTVGMRVVYETERLGQRAPASVEVVLFRAVQELLERAVTFAHATHAELHLRRDREELSLEFTDNGLPRTGVDLLHQIERRIREAGGQMHLHLTEDGLQARLVFVVGEGIYLTQREQDILSLLVEGMSNKEIASTLHVSARTVNFHLDNLYSKLGVNTRTEAVVEAIRLGMLPKPR